MRPNKIINNNTCNIINKEDLRQLYVIDRLSKEKIAIKLHISISSLNKILNYYGITKPNKYLSLEEFKQILSPEEFKKLFISTPTKELASHYNILQSTIMEYAKELNIVKTQKDINNYRNNILKNAAKNNWEEKIKLYPKEILEELYVKQNKSQKEIAVILDISKDILQKILNYYNIHKNRDAISLQNLQTLYNQYGGKENYHNYMCNKRKDTWIKNYGSLEGYKKHRSKMLQKAWNSKSPDKQASILKTIIKNSRGKLKSRDSKPNLNFLSLLQTVFGDDYIITREFPIGNKLYDFKINNILIEVNPSITHNITKSPYGKPCSPLYHYNKTKTALDHGYKCLCLWDWTDPNEIIELLQKDFTQTQSTPKRHLFNINTKEHIILQDEPFTPGDGWVEIYDDGSEIS